MNGPPVVRGLPLDRLTLARGRGFLVPIWLSSLSPEVIPPKWGYSRVPRKPYSSLGSDITEPSAVTFFHRTCYFLDFKESQQRTDVRHRVVIKSLFSGCPIFWQCGHKQQPNLSELPFSSPMKWICFTGLHEKFFLKKEHVCKLLSIKPDTQSMQN